MKRVPLGEREFARWLTLFNESVDALLTGPQADDVKLRAARIASVMHHHIQTARQCFGVDFPRRWSCGEMGAT